MKAAVKNTSQEFLNILVSLDFFPLVISNLILEYHVNSIENLLMKINKLLEKYPQGSRVPTSPYDISFHALYPAINSLQETLQTVPQEDEKLKGSEELKELEKRLVRNWRVMDTPPFLEGELGRCRNLLDQVAMFLIYFRLGDTNHKDQDVEVALQIKNLMLECLGLCSLKTYTINVALVKLMGRELTSKDCWYLEEDKQIQSYNFYKKALDQRRVLNGQGGDHLGGVCFKWFETCGQLERTSRTICTDLLPDEKGYQVLLDDQQAEKLKELCQQAGDITPKPLIVEDTNYRFGA